MPASIAIVMPALNEENSLQESYRQTKNALVGAKMDHEIIIVNDGSTDKSGLIADEIKAQDSCVKVIHLAKNHGMGYAFKIGYNLTSKEFYTIVPADGEFEETQIRRILEHIGKKDILLPVLVSNAKRSLLRQNISGVYVKLLNVLFGLDIKNYSLGVFRTKDLKVLNIRSNWNTFCAEIIVKMVKQLNCNYDQSFTFALKERTIGHSKTKLSLANIRKMAIFFLFLIYDIYIGKK